MRRACAFAALPTLAVAIGLTLGYLFCSRDTVPVAPPVLRAQVAGGMGLILPEPDAEPLEPAQPSETALGGVLADTAKLRAILDVIAEHPELVQAQASRMGLPALNDQDLAVLLAQLRENPEVLGQFASGAYGSPEALAQGLGLGEQSAMGSPSLGALSALLGQQGGEALGPGSTSLDLLGAGATLSMLADMLVAFGGGAEMERLQALLREGDLAGLLAMVQEAYGPNGTLAQDPLFEGRTVNSYTDLLNALLELGE